MKVALRLMSCLLALTSPHTLKGANAGEGTHVIPTADKNCAGYDLDGKVHDLAGLERKDGQPRFWVVSGGWNYTYNPCRPFSQGTTQASDCFGDVAVCMGAVNKARYQLIGTQSSFHYGFNKETHTPQFVYTNKESFPNRQVIIDLKCDPSKKTPEEALFVFISDTQGIWKFLLTSICSCPDGCPSDSDDPLFHTHTHTGAGVNKLAYIIPSALAGIMVVVAPALYYYCKRNTDGTRPVQFQNEGEDNGADAGGSYPAGVSSGSNNERNTTILNEINPTGNGNKNTPDLLSTFPVGGGT